MHPVPLALFACVFLALLPFSSSQDYQPQINKLNTYTNQINAQMSQNTGQVNQLTQEMYGYGNQIWNIYTQTTQLEKTYATLRDTVDRLNKINQMWSKNFKIMEVTFKQIRRSVDFKLQSPQTI